MKILEIISLPETDIKKAASLVDKIKNYAFRKGTGAGVNAADAVFIQKKDEAAKALLKKMQEKANEVKPVNGIFTKDPAKLTKPEIDNVVGEVLGDLVLMPSGSYVKKYSHEHLVPVEFTVQVPSNTPRKVRKPGEKSPPSTTTQKETRMIPFDEAPPAVQDKIRQETKSTHWVSNDPKDVETLTTQALAKAEDDYKKANVATTTGEANLRFDKVKEKASMVSQVTAFAVKWGFDGAVLAYSVLAPYSRFLDKIEQLRADLDASKIRGQPASKENAKNHFLNGYEAEKKVLIAEVAENLLAQFSTKLLVANKGTFGKLPLPLSEEGLATMKHLFLPFCRLLEKQLNQDANFIFKAMNTPVARFALVGIINWEQISQGIGAAVVNFTVNLPTPPGFPDIQLKPGNWITGEISSIIPELDAKAKELLAKEKADAKTKQDNQQPNNPTVTPPNNPTVTPPIDTQSGSRADRLSGFN